MRHRRVANRDYISLPSAEQAPHTSSIDVSRYRSPHCRSQPRARQGLYHRVDDEIQRPRRRMCSVHFTSADPCLPQPPQIGELLKDSRRINVILTRARSKLIIVGSRTTLAGTAAPPGGADEVLLPKLMRVLSTNKWMMTLPPEAHTLHQFASPPKSAAQLPEDSCEIKSTPKKGHIGSNIFKSRSMLRDIANDI